MSRDVYRPDVASRSYSSGDDLLAASARSGNRARLTGVTASAVACLTLVSLIVGAQEAAAGAEGPGGVATLVPLERAWGDDSTGEGRRASRTGAWDAATDLGSARSVAEQVGASRVWTMRDPNDRSRPLTGAGVGVALIDTGVAPVEGLSTPGKIVRGPDLSLDSQADNTRNLDANGHGTHLAGLIAGKDSDVRTGKPVKASQFVGMAPDAQIIDVRVGAADGAVDVSQVIAGIDWVVANRAAYNIRVLNLAYGTGSVQDPAVDPLAHAVESAWRAGIVVVVAAGNEGEAGPTALTMPAADPFVLAVGSADHRGSASPADWRLGSWTNSGTAERGPDLVAPGKSVVSLRVPGSFVDQRYPEGLVAGAEDGRMLRGTGTSQSAAIVSGAAALLLQRNPELTPDQVKGLLVANADRLVGETSAVQGAGLLDVDGAVDQLAGGAVPAFTQTMPYSTGLGSLEAARGGTYVVDPETGEPLAGEQDLFGVTWDPATWAPASTAGTAWDGGTWRGTQWAGAGWLGDTWAATAWEGRSWSGRSWSGRSWSGRSWSGRSWSGENWTGDDWAGRSWSGRSWSGDEWTGRSWSDDDWAGRSWSGDEWTGRSWSGRSWS